METMPCPRPPDLSRLERRIGEMRPQHAQGHAIKHLAEMRAASDEPEFCKHMEAVVMAAPDADAILKRRREAIRAALKARAADRRKMPWHSHLA
jgi:hypothetical protein